MVPNTPRLKSKIYIISLITICLYSILIIMMVIGRKHYIRESDGVCYIGLKPHSSWGLLCYDLYINVFLTSLFLWPLLKFKIMNDRIRRVAIRTLVASAISLTTSTVNMAILAVHHDERGWMCLAWCTSDIIINALAIFWITKNVSPPERYPGRSDPGRPDRSASRSGVTSGSSANTEDGYGQGQGDSSSPVPLSRVVLPPGNGRPRAKDSDRYKEAHVQPLEVWVEKEEVRGVEDV
ncbi:hypothetical protein D9758_011125 [Tetrapyrgos nigripes]|uniref:Uncharacterized protein n=1 Tax=Tetrapyrgos nigripes TaxID=182062 RepID=A0A8H5CKD7_9AGAR|nr:hypothetical protein D9758_011125 [Tetrapyrgos nigripes]